MNQALGAGSGSVSGFILMAVIDILFLGVVFLLMAPVFALRPASYAVMKRNFINYFSNPTGYVFLCVFVLLTSFAAFWPHEFFANNLANFDQLNKVLPYVMLVFIPAITMSVWAEEKRQGTDELLLTLPALDFDIVIGKYFATVFVFTVSLLFSQLSNFAVLLALTGGNLDDGILLSTYLGYWFVGLAMLALGMVASFLTNNLTISFIFGVVLNAPLAFFSNADVLFSSQGWVDAMYEWSLLRRFADFGRGLINLPSIVYFVGLAAVGIYLSLVLIGRRHWMGGRDGRSLLGHLLTRAAALAVICASVVMICQYSPLNRALRLDLSNGNVNTLSPDSLRLLSNLKEDSDAKRPVLIEAYISDDLPPEYVQTRYELVNLLKEFDVIGGDRIQVRLHENVSPFGEEALLAEKRYGIKSQRVTTRSRGALRDEDVVLGVAFSSGLQRIVIPFFHYGMPVEYELVRSISTVASENRKTVGIVETDAFLAGLATRQGMIPPAKIVGELQKQYNVVRVNSEKPISIWADEAKTKRNYDVLLVVQPSKMAPVQMSNLQDAIETGQPVAIFEDPLPFGAVQWPPGSLQDQKPEEYSRVAPSSMPRMNGQISADLENLYTYLGIQRVGRNQAGGGMTPGIVWQKNQTYPQSLFLNKHLEYVVVRTGAPQSQVDLQPDAEVRPGAHPIVANINEVAFPYAGAIMKLPNVRWEVTPLVQTGNAGLLYFDKFEMTGGNEQLIKRERGTELQPMVLAAEINGGASDGSAPGVNAVYVADTDFFSDYFVNLRNLPSSSSIEYRFDNVAFFLNIIDYLANEERFIKIRNRRSIQYTLARVESEREKEWLVVNEKMNEAQKEMETLLSQVQQDFMDMVAPTRDSIQKLQRQQARGEPYDAQRLEQLQRDLTLMAEEEQRNLETTLAEKENSLKEEERRIRMDAEIAIQKIQSQFKVMAVLLPPIPPLILGLIVFTRRRLREREGISKARLRT